MKIINKLKNKIYFKKNYNNVVSTKTGRYKVRLFKLYERCGLKYD